MTRRNDESTRAKRYPAGADAMAHFRVIERLPEGFRPSQPGTTWPAYLNEFFGDETVRAYEGERTNRRDTPKAARPSPREIDDALAWLNADPCNCAWMWDANNRDDWHMFTAFAKGASVQAIADYYHTSRPYISARLDSIFYQIQVEQDVAAMRQRKAG